MANLLDVIDKEFPTLFLKDDVTRTITIVWTQNKWCFDKLERP
jgi:hypothetical protein